jgi:hypothetical protein
MQLTVHQPGCQVIQLDLTDVFVVQIRDPGRMERFGA